VVAAAKGGLVSDGFVVPADVVSHLGNGSSEAGLKLLASRFGAEPIKGDGDGMSDSIPTKIDGVQEARVANEEAFISPEMVERLGNGDSKKGAKKLYAMMDQIRKDRTGTTKQGKQIEPDKYMPGGSVGRYATGGTTVPAGEYIEMYWGASDTNVTIGTTAPTPPHPGIPANVIAVNFIAPLPVPRPTPP